MIYRHTDAQIREYFDSPALNQTAIKSLLKDGMQGFVRKIQMLLHQEDLPYEENNSLLIGSAADYKISQGQEAFNEKYFFSSLKKKPGPKELSIIHQVFDIVSARVETTQIVEDGEVKTMIINPIQDLVNYKRELYDSCNVNVYYMNRKRPSDKDIKADFKVADDPDFWQKDNRPDGLLASGLAQTYWSELITSLGKQILSDEQKIKVDTITNSWLTHPHTAYLFQEREGIDIIYQMPIYFKVGDTECKILIDMVIIDHNKKIIKIVDFKTMWNDVLNFKYAIRERRYDIQSSFYLEGVSSTKGIQQISKLISKSLEGYTVQGFAFVVESTGNPGIPIIFPMTIEALGIGMRGKKDIYIMSKGWIDGLHLYQEWANAEWNIEKRLESSNGVVFIGNDLEYEINI